MANAFSSLLGIGGGGTNRIGNALTGFSTAIERGLEDPQVRDARAAQEQQAEAQKQAAQFKFIQSSAAFLDTLSPQQQKAYLDINGPLFVEQGIIGEEDVPLLFQNIGVPGGFTGLARSAIDPNQQQQNVFESQTIAETGRSNRATEGLRGGELGVSRGNLAVSQGRLGEDRRQFDARLAFDQQNAAAKLDSGNAKQEALNTWITARNGLIEALRETETGPIRGRLPAFSADQQTAEGAIAATAPVLKQIFRVAGEGVFTDRDQALLLDMVPKRTDRQDARIAKIRNIDAIINAKLGITQNVQPIPIETPRLTPPDLSSLSDAELEAIANGGR